MLYLFFFLLILVTVIGGRPNPGICFLPEWLKLRLLPNERYGESRSDCASNTQPSNSEADTLPLSYCLSFEERSACFEKRTKICWGSQAATATRPAPASLASDFAARFPASERPDSARLAGRTMTSASG